MSILDKKKLLFKVGLNALTQSKTYLQVPLTTENILNAEITHCKKIEIHVNGTGKILVIIYWQCKRNPLVQNLSITV